MPCIKAWYIFDWMLIDKKAKQMYMMHIYTQDDAIIISLFRVTGETERQRSNFRQHLGPFVCWAVTSSFWVHHFSNF